MPQRDVIHQIVKQALIRDGWEITDDPFVISFGERFLFIDLGATAISPDEHIESGWIGAQRGEQRIAIEIKEFRGKSVISDLEQAIGQYMLYRLLLNRIEPERSLYLEITEAMFDDSFREPIGDVVIHDLPLQLLVVDREKQEVRQWIPQPIVKLSNKQS